MRHVSLLPLLLLAACTAPTLQRRQDNWRKWHRGVTATCVIGPADPAMPADVRDWCLEIGTK